MGTTIVNNSPNRRPPVLVGSIPQGQLLPSECLLVLQLHKLHEVASSKVA